MNLYRIKEFRFYTSNNNATESKLISVLAVKYYVPVDKYKIYHMILSYNQ